MIRKKFTDGEQLNQTWSSMTMLLIVIAFLMACRPSYARAAEASEPDGGDVVKICIDPGHGGENEGGLWEDYVEKDMTMIVAEAMRDELMKYSGIEVYMTRTGDVDMSLEERVEYASEVGADFFFCLHFNLSADHDMYGSECWISAFGENYARGMDFSKIEMKLLTDLGLYDRGIKTRLNSRGTNYYGVLRVGDVEGVPGVIIEHCHLDHREDEPYYDHYDWLVKYGRLDATAVATYYGLKSDELGVDYSNYAYEPTPVPDSVVKPDESEPVSISAEFGEVTESDDGYVINARLNASDPDSRMLYYSYSTDGGIHWSDRFRWENHDGRPVLNEPGESAIDLQLPLSTGRDMYVIFRGYNLYNLSADSEPYYVSKYEPPEEDEPAVDEYADYVEIERPEDEERSGKPLFDKGTDYRFLSAIAIMSLTILVLLIVMANLIFRIVRNNGRHGR